MTREQKETTESRYKEFYNEMTEMEKYLEDVKKALSEVKSDTKLKEEIGIYLGDFPEFKWLDKVSESVKEKLRKVISGELEVVEAYELIVASQETVMDLRESFNRDVLLPMQKRANDNAVSDE